jgi:phosphatidylglycerol:prolipoprotein diacylglycerol transferase
LGGLFGGGLVGWVHLKRARVDVAEWLDIAGVVIPLGQAIGRWGNYFNQEIFGSPTALPWGIFIDPGNRPVGMESFERFHPLFLYESLACLVLFVMLYRLYGKRYGMTGKKTPLRVPRGRIFLFYVTSYCVIRFFLEFLRAEPAAMWKVSGLNVVQVICGLVVLIASIGCYRLTKTLK